MALAAFLPEQQQQARGVISSGFSCVLHMPTGSGKTHLAWQAVQQEVALGGRAILCVPMRALAAQLHERFTRERPDLRIGRYTGDQVSSLAPAQAQVLIMTPERLDAYTRTWARHWSWLPAVSLLVVDEFHLLGEGRRGARLEGTLMRLERLNPLCRVVALSATLGNPAALAQWLGGVEYSHPWRPVPLHWREVTYPNPDAKERVLLEVLREARGGTLIFVQSRRKAEQLAARLQGAGLPAQHHHAGLTPQQRQQVEAAFTSGSLPYLVCTSTLELGLNLPCRHTVLYDLNVWNGHTFAPLPVRNAWQRAGRAGRYGLDSAGEVVIVRAAWDSHLPDYATGQFEPVESQLSQDSFVLEQLVTDIGCGLLRTRAGLERYYARSLAWQQGTQPALRPLLERALAAGLVTDDPEDKRLRVTPAGKVAAQHLLAPETVLRWQNLPRFSTPFDLLWFFITLPDTEVRLPVNYEVLPDLRSELNKVPSRLLRTAPNQVGAWLELRGRPLLHSLHTTCALWTHLNGEEADQVAERFDAYPFEFQKLRQEAGLVVTAARQWVSATVDTRHPEQQHVLTQRLTLLQAMLAGPLSAEAATLTRVTGIGTTWANILQQAGVTDLEALALAEARDLAHLPRLSAQRAAHWISTAETLVKDWTEVWEHVQSGLHLTDSPLPTHIDPYRLLRAAELQVQPMDYGYRVTGGQEPHRIQRRAEQFVCDCADYLKGNYCKHLLAVELGRSPQLRSSLAALQVDPDPEHTTWTLETIWMQA